MFLVYRIELKFGVLAKIKNKWLQLIYEGLEYIAKFNYHFPVYIHGLLFF